MSEFYDSGRLEDHPFGELAGQIFRESRTGELTLESAQRRRSVWFLGGNPVAVVSADPQDHLAQFLLEHGRVSPEDAQRLAALPETREALGAADYLPKDTLTWGVKSRFVNLCYDLFKWDEGDYAFREGDPPRDLFLLKVPAHSLIFKGVGYVAQGAVNEAVPDGAVCAAGPVAADDARYLGPDVRKLLDECHPGRTVAEALGGGWDDPDQARRMLYALRCLGLVSLEPPAAAAPAAAPGAEPAFALDDEFGQTDLSGTAAEVPGADLSLEAEHAVSEPDFSLPPLDADSGPARSGDGTIELPPGTAPAGGYPFDDEPSAGAFGSFGSDLSLDRGDEPPAVAAKGSGGGPKRAAKASRFNFHIPRIAGIAVGGLAAAALIGGAAWWWLGASEPQPVAVKVPARAPARPAPAPPAPPAPPVAAPAAPAAPAATPEPAPQAVAVAPLPAPAPAAAPGPPAVPAQPAAPASAPSAASAPTPQPRAAAPAPAGTDRYQNALQVFRAGDLDAAASMWESLLEGQRQAYTLLLLTACQPETIRDAQRALSSQRVYLVSKKVNGRNCFRVCAGTFESREAAVSALAGLPGEFRSAGAAVRPVADVLKRDR